MALYLSHSSALRYWLTKTKNECIPEAAPVTNLAMASSSAAEAKAELLPIDFSTDRPLHVLVGDRALSWKLDSIRTHVWRGPIPSGALCSLVGQNCVSSPEFVFVQMAYRRSLVDLVEIGCYLCGTFAISDEGRGYMGERAALTTPEEIARFISRIPGAYGSRLASRALSYVVPGAASPMEVLLVLAFVLPPALGGWVMPEISANQHIPIDEDLRVLADATHFVGDIYLPSVRGDVEYDSKEFHSGSYRLDHTQTRRNVLEAMQIKTVSATPGQVSTFEKFEAFIRMVKRRFGLEQCEFTAKEREAQIELYERMTSTKRTLF